MIVWKQTDRIISAGEVLLRKDARMSLIKTPNGINLQIANVTPDDRGKSIYFIPTGRTHSANPKLEITLGTLDGK